MQSYDHFVKQTNRNRCVIAGPDGPLTLTLPVEHGDKAARPCTRDIRLSSHGNWPHLHRTALRSAYEGSPYFEYYADDLLPLYDRSWSFLVDFNEALTEVLLGLLDLHPDIRPTSAYADAVALGSDDVRQPIRPSPARGGAGGPGADACREPTRPHIPFTDDPTFTPKPYYQIFSARTGFLPNLSMVDLLFNMGPESRLVLRDSIF